MDPELKNIVNIEDEMRQSYIDYAMTVIVGRALPDVRDGLKPVQRRVLYAMHSEGMISTKKTSKCAGVVGEVLKTLHPHGDSSVYDALVRLAQPWALRYPLVDGQGNFGSIDGDPPAAYRYTECRMTALTERLLLDIDKDTVDFCPNFDDTSQEPTVLPSLVPTLLINGADGIAVGMATHIPPHNLLEVIAGTTALIDDGTLTARDLMRYIPGPDFPTGGIINGKKGIVSAYTSGKGILQIRARTQFEHIKARGREVEAIVVNEIPFQLNKSRLIEKIAELVNAKTLDGVARLRDESDRSGMRIVIELKRDATPEVVLNQLFKLTPLQTSFGIINLAIVGGRPIVCTLPELLTHFVNHRRDVVTRRIQFDLRKAKERMHLLEGFRIALMNIDEVIQLIKQAQTPAEARVALIARYELSELQAQAILDLRLQKLTGMERLAIEKEYEELRALIDQLNAILRDSGKIDAIIKAELQEVGERFGDKRRTVIGEEVEDFAAEDLIEDEDMVVTVTHNGYVKRTSASNYRAQRRGGKGVTGVASREEDFVEHLFVTSSLADLLVFSSLGRVYSLKVYEIPEAGRAARGRALINLLPLREEEGVTALLPVRNFSDDRFIVMVTRAGIIKRLRIMDLARVRRSGIIACSLDSGDRLIGIGVTQGHHDIALATRKGMAIRFNEDAVREMGRSARGVRGIRLEGDDEVVGVTTVAVRDEDKHKEKRSESDTQLLTVCENGFGKRTALEDYRAQGRGGKGVIDIRTSGRNGDVVGACVVDDDSEFMLITSGAKIIRISAKDVSVVGRNTMGVKLVDLEEDEKVAAIAPLEENGNGDSGE